MPPTAAKSLRWRIAEFFKFVHFVAITAYVNGFTQLKLFRLYIENTGVFVLLQRTIQPKKSQQIAAMYSKFSNGVSCMW